MGWFTPYGVKTKKELIDFLKRETERMDPARGSVKQLAGCYRGNRFSGVYWSVIERKELNKEPVRYIHCDFLSYSQGSWSYKPISEEMGPHSYSCPLSYLAMALDHADYAWRDKVAQHHAETRIRGKLRRALKTI